MDVREVKSSDFKSILDIYDQGYEELKEDPDFGDYFRLTRPDAKRKAYWSKCEYEKVHRGDSIFIVAEEGKKIIGFCFVTKKDIPDSEMSHVGVLAIRVAKDWRGKGTGTKLLEYTLNKCRGKFEMVEIFPFKNNLKAKRLYRKFGFRTWGIAPGYIKRGKKYMDLEYMYLKL